MHFLKIREYPSSKEINFGIIAAGSKKYGVEILKNSKRPDTDMSQVLYMNIMRVLKEAYHRRSNPSELWRGKKNPSFLYWRRQKITGLLQFNWTIK